MCQTCAKLVDNDEKRFTESVLKEWKQKAEVEALSLIGKTSLSIAVNNNNRLFLLDERFKMVIEDYKIRGTPKYMIDTFHDLTIEEKAQLYDKAVEWKKGRKSKNNPYMKNTS